MMPNRVLLRGSVALLVVIIGISGALNRVSADEGHHEGMFVGVRAGQIAILDRNRLATNIYPLTNFVKVTRNGHDATLNDLQRGDAIQIMTETRFRSEYVISVEAVSSDAPG